MMQLRSLLLLLSCFLAPAVKSQTCGGTYRGFQYTIASPNYPRGYPESLECTYHLQADQSTDCEQDFHLQFQDFDVRPSDDCRDDYVRVGDRSVFCGAVTGLRSFTGAKNNSLTIRFHSGATKGPARGFKILVMAIPCSLKLSTRPRNHANDVGALSSEAHGSQDQIRITPYLFLPPTERQNHTDLLDEASTSLPMELRPPSLEAVAFRPSEHLVSWDKSSTRGLHTESLFDPQLGPASCDKGGDPQGQPVEYNAESANLRNNYYPQDASRLGSTANLIYDPHRGLYQQQSGYNYLGYPTSYQSLNTYNPYQSTFNPYNPWNSPGGYLGSRSGECCRLPTASRRFLLSSPGFPGSVSNTYACRYTIAKASPDVCRLRLNLRYFNFGADSGLYCSHGHLEIDGRHLCGCRTGQTLQLPFAEPYAKQLSVTFRGYPRNNFAGFLVDVVQESCGYSSGYYPTRSSYPCANSGYPCTGVQPYDPTNPIYSPYLRRRQDLEAVASPSNSSTVGPRAKRDLGYYYPKPSVSFEDSGEADVITAVGYQPRDRLFGGNCQSRVLLDWVVASKEAALRSARCERFGIYRSASDRSDSGGCEEVAASGGSLRSPERHNAGIDKCWRFNGAGGACKLEVRLEDFGLEEESSQGCEREYLSFSNEDKRYCGSSLNNQKRVFDLRQMGAVDIRFVSDSREAGSAFNIVFSQQPCAN
ncbi:uncharacterized protein LOC106647348 [Copidosoma floridanum]|uniref:uncharacterized protein LOC106647348 n=1 Tax=Copidosoma floridanum TaxID=29053 RepID=UPI0006C9DDEB|nr:uncharacterized protein LOC106647348 [Copidosoma floridanum]